MKRLLAIILCFMFALLGSAMAAVNINTATKDELDSLKGIGPAKAQAIVDYRAKNGPFKSTEELKNVNGIGAKTFENFRNDVTVGGSTAANPTKPPMKSEETKKAAPSKVADTPKASTGKPTEPTKPATPAPAVAAKSAEPAKNAASKEAPKADAKKVDAKEPAPGKKSETKSETAHKAPAAK